MVSPLRPRSFCVVLASLFITALSQAAAPTFSPDWAKFLARHDLTWSKNPAAWEEAVFIGNGNLGASIFQKNNHLGWEVNRADFLFERSRYPMGNGYLATAGKITSADARLDLWNAEARGVITTDRGTVRWRSFTATAPSVIVIETEASEGEATTEFAWQAAEVRSPRKLFRKERLEPADLHPPGEYVTTPSGFVVRHQLNAGPAFVISVKREVLEARRVYVIAVGTGSDVAAAERDADRALHQAAGQTVEQLATSHRAWWHAYYPASFLSVPDARLEAFYWIQVYKLGSAMHENGPILDLMGPWFRHTPWPRIWWNLNVQLTYHPLAAANRLSLSESLFRALDERRQALIDNVPPRLRATAAAIGRSSDQSLVSPIDLETATGDAALEAGNLPWVGFLYWEFYRYQMKSEIFRERTLPLLSRAIGHYLGYVHKGDDGFYHLPKTHSPEFASVPDTNYDLAFLRWGLRTLISTCEELKINDPQLPRWREVEASLVPALVDQTGLMIGRGRSLDSSHRHYSHLVGIYPLRLITPDQPRDRELIERSIAHWHSMPEKHQGYSYTGAASMLAMLEDGGRALEHLNKLLDGYIKPNTMYTEAGPVIETPLSAMSSLQEMLLQSWGGKLRIFPAIPRSWPDAAFHDLRGEGAYLVSALRRDGRTAWVRIHSEVGGHCHIVIRDWERAVVRSEGGERIALSRDKPGEFSLKLPAGGTVILAPDDTSPLPDLQPVAIPAAQHNPYPQRYR